jgi:hypothetical protein
MSQAIYFMGVIPLPDQKGIEMNDIITEYVRGGRLLGASQVRYTRIPDPAHVLSARGGQGGRNENADNHRRRSSIKKCLFALYYFFFMHTRWDSVLKN